MSAIDIAEFNQPCHLPDRIIRITPRVAPGDHPAGTVADDLDLRLIFSPAPGGI